MVPQIPYAAIGTGIAVILGIWAFIIADTIKERAWIAGAAVIIFLAGAVFRSRTGQLVVLIGWIIYGIGCIIYLRLSGMEIR